MTAQDQFLDTAQAAHYLGYSMSALEYWRTKSQGPKYYKLNRRVRYKQSDLDAWIENQVVTPKREVV